MPPNEFLLTVAAAAAEAGRRIMPFFKADCSHHLKADRSPVTEADLASHAFLVSALAKLVPRRPVVSEESAPADRELEALPEEYWLVDPLDGTKEFLKGQPEFTVNIALMRNLRPVLGVVHAPALGLTCLAQTGQGAWRQTGGEVAEPIRTRAANPARLTVVASKDHSGPRVKRMLDKLGAPELTSIGSSLKFCLVAEGRADLYFRDVPTMEWDTAAAQCVVEAAGGLVLGMDGAPLGYGKPGMKNAEFVTVGDPGFRWQDFVPAS